MVLPETSVPSCLSMHALGPALPKCPVCLERFDRTLAPIATSLYAPPPTAGQDEAQWHDAARMCRVCRTVSRSNDGRASSASSASGSRSATPTRPHAQACTASPPHHHTAAPSVNGTVTGTDGAGGDVDGGSGGGAAAAAAAITAKSAAAATASSESRNSTPSPLPAQPGALQCGSCSVCKDLWVCMVCGQVGCSRPQYGEDPHATGGNKGQYYSQLMCHSDES